MSNTGAHINKDILVWARTCVKLSVPLAAEKIGVNQEKLELWEKGDAYPTIKQLYKIAQVYKRPFALFYFPKPPKHFKLLKDFRKFQQQFLLTENEEYILQKELLLFQQKRQIALDLYEQLEMEAPQFKIKGTVDETPEKLAKQIAGYLSINYSEIINTNPGYDALNYWKKLLESKGILVFQTTGIPLHIMRGACIAKEVLPVIIINSNDTQNGRIFSLFHEFAHIVLREDGISNFRYSDKDLYDKIEVYCNQVAAEVLVPSELLLKTEVVQDHNRNDDNWSSNEINQLSRRFCVSQEVILRRLLTLHKTNNSFYQNFRNNQDFEMKKKSSGGDYYRNVIAKNGALFLHLALQGYYQDKVTSSSLSDFIQIKISNLSKLENLLYAKV
ncbi:MAG: XRE family transcriptional regulator [Bacteroidota bacterium]